MRRGRRATLPPQNTPSTTIEKSPRHTQLCLPLFHKRTSICVHHKIWIGQGHFGGLPWLSDLWLRLADSHVQGFLLMILEESWLG